MNKRLISCISAAAAAAMIISSMPTAFAAQSGWVTNKATGETSYIRLNGTLASGTVIIGGKAYSFTSDGVLEGFYTGIITIGDDIYYYENGDLYTDGWLRRDGYMYYFTSDGTAAVGMREIDSVVYSFDADGKLNMPEASAAQQDITITCAEPVSIISDETVLYFAVSAIGWQGTVSFGEISELQQYRDGKWYIVSPDSSFRVPASGYLLGNVNPSAVMLGFSPTSYKKDISAGHYRIAMDIYANNKLLRRYCEFDLLEPYRIETSAKKYDVSQTESIVFTCTSGAQTINVNKNVTDLYHMNESGQWEYVSAKKSAPALTSESIYLSPGESAYSVLDLSRYSSMVLTSGQYRAAVGNGLYCDFELTVPLTVNTEQIKLESARKKQILVTAANYQYQALSLKGKLYKYDSSGKLKAVSLKSGKTSPFNREIAGRYSSTYSVLLTDYYSGITSGKYVLAYPVNDGYTVYSVFDIK